MIKKNRVKIKKTKLIIGAPKINQNDPVVLELWVRAGGRCEFHGCNRYLLQDELTTNKVKLANIAHIVAREKNGPRGKDPLPFENRNEIDNLMLTCPTCHKLIDNKKLVSKYPKELLLKYKRQHEDRVYYLTNFSPEYETVVIRMKGNIRTDAVTISNEQIRKSVLECAGRYPRYLGGENNIEIDLARLPSRINRAGWESGKKIIVDIINRLVTPAIENKEIKHLSIFALARIPFLIYLGSLLSDKVPTDIYQKHRDSEEGWIWKEYKKNIAFKFIEVQKGKDSSKVALVLSISGKIDIKKLPRDIITNATIYEIIPTKAKLSRNLIETKSNLEEFRRAYECALRKIESQYKNAKKICLFPAIPVSVAIACGRERLKNISPSLLVYDVGEDGKFKFTMEVK